MTQLPSQPHHMCLREMEFSCNKYKPRKSTYSIPIQTNENLPFGIAYILQLLRALRVIRVFFCDLWNSCVIRVVTIIGLPDCEWIKHVADACIYIFIYILLQEWDYTIDIQFNFACFIPFILHFLSWLRLRNSVNVNYIDRN